MATRFRWNPNRLQGRKVGSPRHTDELEDAYLALFYSVCMGVVPEISFAKVTGEEIPPSIYFVEDMIALRQEDSKYWKWKEVGKVFGMTSEAARQAVKRFKGKEGME